MITIKLGMATGGGLATVVAPAKCYSLNKSLPGGLEPWGAPGSMAVKESRGHTYRTLYTHLHTQRAQTNLRVPEAP
jgi:hypothetical protein